MIDLSNLDRCRNRSGRRRAGRAALSRPAGVSLGVSPRRDRFHGDDGPRLCAANQTGGGLLRQYAGPRIAANVGRRHTKFLLRLQDGRHIESVYIPDTPAQTFCISTQVGCAMNCAFCLTGKMGLTRNLSAGEIAGQARVLAHATGLADRPFNIVLMGMGEPLHNYDATIKALGILADDAGTRGESPPGDALDRRRPARAQTSGGGAADAQSCHLPARDDRGAARRARADQPEVPAGRADRRSARNFPCVAGAASRSSTSCWTK